MMEKQNMSQSLSRAERREQSRKEFLDSISHKDRQVTVIPENPALKLGYAPTPGRKLNVAAYCRVSTDSDDQLYSYELQRKTYTEMIEKNPDWKLYGIFADEGISGTSRAKRQQFNLMIVECQRGNIDYIITKSISRFARNLMDTLSVVRYLSSLAPPVNVHFENENLNSVNLTSEVILALLAAMAEEESHTKSLAMKWSIRQRFKNGRYLTPTHFLLAYTKVDGKLVIEQDKAVIVELIYSMFLAGFSQDEIADTLNELGCVTVKENRWTSGSVTGILKNEKYCGSVRAQKTVTLSYRTHQVVQNKGQEKQFIEKGHHEGIVTRLEFGMAQKLLATRGYNSHHGLTASYRARVIPSGVLKGFIPMHPYWAGLELNQYLMICSTGEEYVAIDGRECENKQIDENESALCGSANGDAIVSKKIMYFPGFEVSRVEDVCPNREPTVTISVSGFKFNKIAFEALNQCEYVEILLHPIDHLLAVRPSGKFSQEAVCWRKVCDDGKVIVKNISARRVSELIYELMGWLPIYTCHLYADVMEKDVVYPIEGRPEYLYDYSISESEMAAGQIHVKERILVFELDQTLMDVKPEKEKTVAHRRKRKVKKTLMDIEALIAQQTEELRQEIFGDESEEKKSDKMKISSPDDEFSQPKKKETRYPEPWRDNFGEDSLTHKTKGRTALYELGYWNVMAEAEDLPGIQDSLDVGDDILRDLTKQVADLTLAAGNQQKAVD